VKGSGINGGFTQSLDVGGMSKGMNRPLSNIATAPGAARDDAAWLLIGFMIIITFGFQLYAPFSFDWSGAVGPALFLAVLQLVILFYVKIRPRPDFAIMFTGLQQMILFSAVGATLSYMVAAQGGEFWDKQLQGWDQMIGFEWRSYLFWTNAHPAVGRIFSFAYASLIPQMVVIILALGLSGRGHSLRIVMFAAMLTGLATILISGLMPAMCNFVYLGLTAADYPNLDPSAAFVHVRDMQGLRSGTLRTLSVGSFEGIITFPSYHAGLAAAFAYGYLKMPYLRWPGLALAALTLAATPIDGGHYLVDVLAGIAIAAISIAIAHRAVGWRMPCFAFMPHRQLSA
jgi:membrane-associated phospholipid phosphatase